MSEDESTIVECDESFFIDAETTVLLGNAVGNIAVDPVIGRPRLLIPQRSPAAIAWIEISVGSGSIFFDCGQDQDGRCDEEHLLREPNGGVEELPPDPSRVVVDDQGFRFAYVPHLSAGALTLIGLDGDLGPELAWSEVGFFREDIFQTGLSGGFSVASRPCDPEQAPQPSEGCSRPLLYSTHRFAPGVREFSVQHGFSQIDALRNTDLAPIGTEDMESRPIMGDLAFENPTKGDTLLTVQTTPGALARVDTRVLDGKDMPANALMNAVGLCVNPNILKVYRSPGYEPLALVTCFSDGLLAVVGLSSFSVLELIEVGEGANEIAVDYGRRQAYVANSRDNTISVVSLDATDPRFLTAWARIGL